MAQAGQSGIVDLTGEDDNDESIARAQAAYEKALAAASRLTNHFESMKTSKPVPYKSPNDHVVPGKKDPFPAIAPKTLVPPRLGTFPNSPRFETNGHKKDEKNNTIPRQDSSVPVRGVWFPQSALGMAASRPGNSPSISERVEGNKRRPKEMTTLTPGAVKSTVRTPRSAAVSAKQNIAETCNKLEEWVNKDPNIIPQQAGVGTPRKPGRLKKDSEEWSPSWDTTNNVEEQKGPRNFISNSPIPSAGMAELRVAEESEESTAHFTDREENLPGSLERSLGKHGGTYGDLKANKGNGLSRIKGISTSLSTKKRKYSGSSQSRDSPVKLARWDKEPSAYHDYTSSSLSDPASGEHIHNGTANSSPAGCFPRCVYPALKAAKAEFKQSITEDELTGIGQGVSFLSDLQTRPYLQRGKSNGWNRLLTRLWSKESRHSVQQV